MTLAVCALVLAPTLAFRWTVDQGVFAYLGGALLEGRWPYVHTWESDFPGLMFIQAAEIFAFGKSAAMFRVFDILVQLGNAFLILRIATRLSGWTAGLLAAVTYCLIYQGYGPWNTAQREGFGLVLVLWGYWSCLTSSRRSVWLTATVVGLGMGVAFTIKPTLLAMSLFYAPLIVQLRNRRAFAVALAAGAALVAPAGLFIVGYWSQGRLRDLYEACVAYQDVYTARFRGNEPLVAYWFGKVARLGLNAKALPVIYAPFLFFGENKRERWMVWLGLLGSIYSVFVQGTFAGYHYLPGLALGGILVGDAFVRVSQAVLASFVPRATTRARAQVALAVVVLLGLCAVSLRRAPVRDLVTLHFLEPPRVDEYRNGTVFDFTESYLLAAYLRERTTRDQPVQIWGYESLTYYLADRLAASRFQMTHPLVMRPPGGDLTPMQLRWRSEFVRDVDNRKPPYVVVVRSDNWWWAPGEQTSEQLLDDFHEWKALIQRDYSLETTIGRFLVYRRSQAARPVGQPVP